MSQIGQKGTELRRAPSAWRLFASESLRKSSGLGKGSLPLALLLLAVCLVYANSFGNSFHFDDFHTITDNPSVRSLRNLPRIFTDTTAFSVLPANQTYRPVVTLSLALDYALGGGYVLFWFHLSTLLWFLLLVALLSLLLQHLLDQVQTSAANRWLALGIAAWFGVHPAMAETVNYIIQRGDLYCTLGSVAALWSFVRWPAKRRYGLYLLPFVIALLAKPPAAVFPLLLLFYSFFFETESLPSAQRWRKSLGAAVPAMLVAVLLLFLQARMTPKTFLPSILSPAQYRLTEGFVWLRYAETLFLPLHLNVDTDLQPFASLPSFASLQLSASQTVEAVAGLVFVLGILLAVAYTARQRRLYPIAYGLLWFVFTQLPTSLYPLSEVENDHRMFFSFPGLMLAVVWLFYLVYLRLQAFVGTYAKLRGRAQTFLPRAALASALLLLSAYGYGAHRRNAIWRSEATLWADDVEKSPHNGRGLMIYGLTRLNAGDTVGALALFNRALLYTPNYATLEINLGVANGVLAAMGRPELTAVAEQHFLRAITLAPRDDTTHAFFGRWLLAQGRLAEGMAQLQAAVALNTQRAMQRDLLLDAYQQTGAAVAAKRLAQQTLVLFPDDSSAIAVLAGNAHNLAANSASSPASSSAAPFINASLAAYRAGQYALAVSTAQEALAVDKNSAEAWNNLGAGYGGLRQWARAIAAEQQALIFHPQLQIAENNLRWFQMQQAQQVQEEARQQVPEQARLPGTAGTPYRVQAPRTPITAAAYIDLSLALNQQGRYAESDAAARQALALDAHAAEAWNNIAANAESLHHWEQAIAAAQKAVSLKPNFQLAKNNLAWAQAQKQAASQSQ